MTSNAWLIVMVPSNVSFLVVPTTGNKPAKQDSFQDNPQTIAPPKRWGSRVGFVAPELSEQLQRVGYTLFRNHDALSVVVPNLEPRQKTAQMPAMDENWNIVSLEKRRYNRDLGFRLRGQNSN
jgi:hypothetical protein